MRARYQLSQKGSLQRSLVPNQSCDLTQSTVVSLKPAELRVYTIVMELEKTETVNTLPYAYGQDRVYGL